MHDLSHYIAALNPIQNSAQPESPVGLAPSNRSTHLLLVASLLALVLGFFILHLSDDGRGRVAPTVSTLLGGLAGVAMLAGGALLGLVAVIGL